MRDQALRVHEARCDPAPAPRSVAGTGFTAGAMGMVADLTSVRTYAKGTAPKLKLVKLGPAKAKECGVFKWGTGWELDDHPAEDGIIVQHVKASLLYTHCKGIPDSRSSEYWEVWSVLKGSLRPANKTYYDDVFASEGFADKSTDHLGTQSIVGEAQFYPGQKQPPGFVATGRPPAWDLPMSWTDPNLTGGTGIVSHSIKAIWNCCTGKTRTTQLQKEPS